jgi:predicted nuclease with RNAse H fold
MSVAVGIDVAEARKGLDLVALDGGRRVVAARRRLGIADVAHAIDDLAPDVVCVDSPPGWATTGKSRAVERELRQFGITAFCTPMDPGEHPFYRWMRSGMGVYAAIALRYPLYRGGAIQHTAAEVFPEASAVLLAGHLRARDESKRHFRRRVLEAARVETGTLRSQDALDAALAALTGILALEGDSCILGDPAEGVLLLPVAELPPGRLSRPAR